MAALIIAGVMFLCMFYMIWQAMRDGRLDRPNEQAEAKDAPVVTSVVGQPVREGECILCGGPLRRGAVTSDDIVCAIERRIDDETDLVAQILSRPAPENLHRLYVS